MRAARTFAALALLIAANACDQVGAPLVDEHGGKVRIPISSCSPPPECMPPEDMDQPVERVEPIGLAYCGNLEPFDCADEPSEPSPLGPSASADFDGGVPDDVGTQGDVTSVPTAPPACGGDVRELPRQLNCQHATSRNASARDDERIEEPSWVDFNLVLQSDVPRKIVLHHPELKNAFIELQGPVTLRIEDSDQVSSLRIAGSATAAGAPRIELAGVWGSEIAIGDDRARFGGAIDVRNSRLSGVQLYAEQLAAESGLLEDGRLDAPFLLANDLELTELVIAVERGVFSTVRLDRVQILRCDELTFVTAHVFATDIPECTGSPVRLFSTSVTEGALDGIFEGDEAHLDGVRVGTRTPSELRLWSSSVASTALCSQLQRLTLASRSSVECTYCESRTFARDAACELPKAKPNFKLNLCEGFEKDAELDLCEDPQPVLHRSVGML
jgi:hypothetical protein